MSSSSSSMLHHGHSQIIHHNLYHKQIRVSRLNKTLDENYKIHGSPSMTTTYLATDSCLPCAFMASVQFIIYLKNALYALNE